MPFRNDEETTVTMSTIPASAPLRRFAALTAGLAGLALAATALGGCVGDRDHQTKPRAFDASPVVEKKVSFRTAENLPFEHSWDLKLPHPVRRSWISRNVPELAFFQVEDSNAIYAVEVMSGNTRWVSEPLAQPLSVEPYVARVLYPSGNPAEPIRDDRLYVIADDRLSCFDCSYGEKIWSMELPFSAASAPLALGPDGNLRVFVGDMEGRTQVVTWDKDRGIAYGLWQWPNRAQVSAAPVASESQVFVGDHKGMLNCFKLDRGLAWAHKSGGAVRGAADVRASTVFYGTTTNTLYALNKFSGEELGQVYLNAAIDRAPFHFNADPNRIYVWTSSSDPASGGLYAIDTKSDTVELAHNLDEQNRPRRKEVERLSVAWFAPGATRLVSSTPEHLYLMRRDSSVIRAVSRATGKAEWAWDLEKERPIPGGGRPKDRDGKHAVGAGGQGEIAHVTAYQDPTDLIRTVITADGEGQLVAYRLFGYNAQDRAAMIKAGTAPAAKPKPAKPAEAAPANAPAPE